MHMKGELAWEMGQPFTRIALNAYQSPTIRSAESKKVYVRSQRWNSSSYHGSSLHCPAKYWKDLKVEKYMVSQGDFVLQVQTSLSEWKLKSMGQGSALLTVRFCWQKTLIPVSVFPFSLYGFQVSVGGTSVPQKENQINDVKSLFRTPHGPWMIVSIDFISECTNDFI